ncbi:MAG: AAA family ATPase [Chloroflexota bacterium]
MQQSHDRLESDAHRLIPDLITQSLARGQLEGTFAAASLYLDLSGFTGLTESLIEHGTDGVETLTTTVESLFAPLVESAFAYGGFVAGYAGDAFSALFPHQEGESNSAAARRALAAAEAMQTSMDDLRDQNQAQGNHPLWAKIGLGLGNVEWGISASSDDNRAIYYFKGQAITEAALAENEAHPGHIVASPSFYHAVTAHVHTLPTPQGYYRIEAIPGPPPAQIPIELPVTDIGALTRFVPASVVRQAAKGEFRQILSLFINLEGEPGSAELREITATIFPLLQRYGGVVYRINFDDKGCNLYLFWGAPISRESDLRRVLGFVLDLRESCEIPLRAGLTYRMAYAGFIGSPLYEEYTCYSRGVNLAARLMASAPWGEIWLDEPMARRTENTHRVELVGDQVFKGFTEPEPFYRLQDRLEVDFHPFFHGEYIGRETELRQLTDQMSILTQGRSAGVYTISGEAGMGKSRLIYEFFRQPEIAGSYQQLLCQSDEILQQPLNAFGYGLQRYFRQQIQGDADANTAVFNTVLDDLIAATPDEELQTELRRTRSFIAHVINLHWPGSLYERVDPQLRTENIQSALKTLFKAMSLRHPLIIHLEDAHALDRDSLAFLPYLMRNVEDYPLALLITTRRPLADDLFDETIPQRVRYLQPLNQSATTRLVESLSSQPPAPELIQFLASHAEGNPLFVEQMLLYLVRDQGYTSQPTGRGRYTQNMPTDVRSLLIARLDQLPPQVRESVQVASILGREFGVGTLAAMVNRPEGIESVLEEGAIRDIWYPLDEQCYLFRHALLKDVAYDMQLGSRRRELHARAATVLAHEVDNSANSASHLAEIAYHYDRGERAEQAATYYGQAGEQAAAAYNNEQAVDYFTRALELTNPANLEARYNLLRGREAVYDLLGMRSEQQADLTAMASALVVLADPYRWAELLLRQAAYSLVLGNYDEAITQAQQSAEAAAAGNDPLAEGRAYHRLGRALWQQGLAAEAEPYLQKALDLVRRGAGHVEEAECLYDLGMVGQYLGNQQTALQYAIEARDVFTDENHTQGLVQCSNLLGMINYSLGQFQRFTSDAYQAGLVQAREIGWRYAESRLLMNISHFAFEFGDYDLAEQRHGKHYPLPAKRVTWSAKGISLRIRWG